MRAAESYRAETGSVWRPRRGSHASQTGKLTSAAIDARDFARARKDRKTAAHLPGGTLVAIAGGKDADPAAVIARLDQARDKYSDIVIVHGGGPGVDRIAARWAETNGVHQIVCKPDWERHGRAAPFRRNDEMLDLLPKGVIAFPGNGITGNLVDKARSSAYPSSRSRPSPHRIAGRVVAPPDRSGAGGGAVRRSSSRRRCGGGGPRRRCAPRSQARAPADNGTVVDPQDR